jgi:chromosome segregation ATPase
MFIQVIDGNENELQELRDRAEELENSKEEYENRIDSLSQGKECLIRCSSFNIHILLF